MASEVTPFGGRRFYMNDYEQNAARMAALQLQENLAGNRMKEQMAAQERINQANIAAQMQMSGTFSDKTAAQRALLAAQQQYAMQAQQAGFGHGKEITAEQRQTAMELARMNPGYMQEQRNQDLYNQEAPVRDATLGLKKQILGQLGGVDGSGGMQIDPQMSQAAALSLINPGLSQVVIGEYGQRKQEERAEKQKIDAVQNLKNLASVNPIAAKEAVRSNPELLEKSLKDPELSTMLALTETEATQLANDKYSSEFDALKSASIKFMHDDEGSLGMGADPNDTEMNQLKEAWVGMYRKMRDSGIPGQTAKKILWERVIDAFNTDVGGLGDKDMTEKLKAELVKSLQSLGD